MLSSHSDPRLTEYSSETFENIKNTNNRLMKDFRIAIYYGVMKAAGESDPDTLPKNIEDRIYNTISSYNEKTEFMDDAPKIVDYTIAAEEDWSHVQIKVYFNVHNNTLIPMEINI